MGSEWEESELGNLVRLQRGHDLTDDQRRLGNVPVMGSAGQNGFHDTSKAKGPGIVLGRSGASFGKVHYSKNDFWPHNTALYVTDFLGNDELFTFHLLKTVDFTSYNTGSAQPSLNRNHLYSIPVSIPPLPEQKAIAHILGSLDDKIELNRRMNATLEGMAQALFKSWFVDFDPVIDNALAAGNPIPDELADRAEVRRQALADGTANREAAKPFPAAFQQTESMGWIPEGWEVQEIRNRTKSIQYGLTQSASDEEVGPKFLRITDIRGGTIDWKQVPYCEIAPEMYEKYQINEGDIFVARTGASTGENVYVTRPERAVFASYLVRFTFDDTSIGRLVGMFMRSPKYFEHIEGILGGSAQPNASAQALASASMVFPQTNITRFFFNEVSAMDQRRAANDRETQTLTKLRVTLLPKLISGELRISKTENLVEVAQ